MLWVADPLAAPVVHEDDMHRSGRRTGLAEVRGVGGRRLTGAGTTKHALEDGQTVVVRNDFLQADGGDMELRTGG